MNDCARARACRAGSFLRVGALSVGDSDDDSVDNCQSLSQHRAAENMQRALENARCDQLARGAPIHRARATACRSRRQCSLSNEYRTTMIATLSRELKSRKRDAPCVSSSIDLNRAPTRSYAARGVARRRCRDEAHFANDRRAIRSQTIRFTALITAGRRRRADCEEYAAYDRAIRVRSAHVRRAEAREAKG